MRNLFLIGIGVLAVLLGVFVFAQVPTNAVVVNADRCFESDRGLDYLTGGWMAGSFWWNVGNSSSNQTQRWEGTVDDVCVSNTTLLEGVCGRSISPIYNNLAAVIVVDCAARAGNSTNSSYMGLCGGHGECY